MKNLVLIGFIFFSISQVSFGQVKLGVKFSYGLMTTNESKMIEYVNFSNASLYNLEHVETKNCKSFGISLYSETKHLFLMSDIMFRNCTDVFKMRTKTSFLDESNMYEESFNKFHIPLVGGLRFGNFKFGAGPIANIVVSSRHEMDVMDDFNMSKKRIRLGYQFLLGYQLDSGVQINLKREINFGSFADYYAIEDRPVNFTKNPKFITLELAAYF